MYYDHSARMYYDHSTCIMSYTAHIRRISGWGGGCGAARPPNGWRSQSLPPPLLFPCTKKSLAEVPETTKSTLLASWLGHDTEMNLKYQIMSLVSCSIDSRRVWRGAGGWGKIDEKYLCIKTVPNQKSPQFIFYQRRLNTNISYHQKCNQCITQFESQ